MAALSPIVSPQRQRSALRPAWKAARRPFVCRSSKRFPSHRRVEPESGTAVWKATRRASSRCHMNEEDESIEKGRFIHIYVNIGLTLCMQELEAFAQPPCAAEAVYAHAQPSAPWPPPPL